MAQAQVALTGRITRAGCERKASRRGTTYTICSIGVRGERPWRYWRVCVVAFGKAGAVLGAHQAGDVVTVTGALEHHWFTGRYGEMREGWKIFATQVISGRAECKLTLKAPEEARRAVLGDHEAGNVVTVTGALQRCEDLPPIPSFTVPGREPSVINGPEYAEYGRPTESRWKVFATQMISGWAECELMMKVPEETGSELEKRESGLADEGAVLGAHQAGDVVTVTGALDRKRFMDRYIRWEDGRRFMAQYRTWWDGWKVFVAQVISGQAECKLTLKAPEETGSEPAAADEGGK